MPRASVHTLLTLDRYARLLGLDPMHFGQGYSTLRPSRACGDVWHQYDWQDGDKVSREQLAAKIAESEQDIADQCGFWPAPVWIEGEIRPYPRPQRTDLRQADGLNIRGRWKSIRLKWGYVIQGGQRATTLLAEYAPTTLDLDGDGFNETARFNVTIDPTTTAECEVHAYFKEYVLADASADLGLSPAELSAVTL